jgi:hypothetical protein
VSCLFYLGQICEKLLLFFGVVGLWFLQGFFAKKVVLTWCFCGEFVVECVVNVVEKQRVFAGRKIGQAFEVYFLAEEDLRSEAVSSSGSIKSANVASWGLARGRYGRVRSRDLA